jgi:hypothetical protein
MNNQNSLPGTLDEVFTLAEDMADGCHNHQTAVGLKQNTETNVRADLSAAEAAQASYKAALTAKTDFSTAVTVADSNGKAFISSARRVLANNLGENWSQAWVATGFPDNSTAVPTTQAKRQALLLSLQNYFTANPGYEVNTPKLVVTAAQAGVLFNALSTARTAAADGNTDAGNKKNLRDTAEQNLRYRLTGLIAELGQLLDDNDPLWLAFGLNEPGATNLPDPADGLALTAGTAGTVLGHWSNSARATRYRVFQQIEGVDPAPVNVVTVSDSNATLTGLPSGKTVKIYVIAADAAGQAAPSDTVQIVVP